MTIVNIFCTYFVWYDSYFIKSMLRNGEKRHLHCIHYQNGAILINENSINSTLCFVNFITFKDIGTD